MIRLLLAFVGFLWSHWSDFVRLFQFAKKWWHSLNLHSSKLFLFLCTVIHRWIGVSWTGATSCPCFGCRYVWSCHVRPLCQCLLAFFVHRELATNFNSMNIPTLMKESRKLLKLQEGCGTATEKPKVRTVRVGRLYCSFSRCFESHVIDS